MPYTVLVNPELTPLGEDMEDGWEGCLSVPGLRGLVPRYRRLRYTGFDEQGRPIDRTVGDFHARVVQHEVDHLEGIPLSPQRIRDLTQFGFTDTLFPDLPREDGLDFASAHATLRFIDRDNSEASAYPPAPNLFRYRECS